MTTTCMNCGRVNECATHAGGEDMVPYDGAISLCIECGAPAVFDSTSPYGLRALTQAERLDLEDNDDYRRVRAAFLLHRILIPRAKRS